MSGAWANDRPDPALPRHRRTRRKQTHEEEARSHPRSGPRPGLPGGHRRGPAAQGDPAGQPRHPLRQAAEEGRRPAGDAPCGLHEGRRRRDPQRGGLEGQPRGPRPRRGYRRDLGGPDPDGHPAALHVLADEEEAPRPRGRALGRPEADRRLRLRVLLELRAVPARDAQGLQQLLGRGDRQGHHRPEVPAAPAAAGRLRERRERDLRHAAGRVRDHRQEPAGRQQREALRQRQGARSPTS